MAWFKVCLTGLARQSRSQWHLLGEINHRATALYQHQEGSHWQGWHYVRYVFEERIMILVLRSD